MEGGPSLFGHISISEEERAHITEQLRRKLTPDEVKTRPGTHGEFTYIEGWKAVELANEIFGFNGWSCQVVVVVIDFVEQVGEMFKIGVTAIVKVVLKDGAYHEDVGFGTGEDKRKGIAIEKAKKEAVTDARKRALRIFGNRLGNCLYNKQYLSEMKKSNATATPTPAIQTRNNNTMVPHQINNTMEPPQITSPNVQIIKQEPQPTAPQPINTMKNPYTQQTLPKTPVGQPKPFQSQAQPVSSFPSQIKSVPGSQLMDDVLGGEDIDDLLDCLYDTTEVSPTKRARI
ncbi:hypothetical protein PROFUN_10575 [Planoprotostelium fungivorum]|uniref:Uncharacterized protein n=1 Tax=Planoprotostelium fungivorum TaxID=1890364 RepID=A0A2P6NCY6_9EUKA|nr:hypothetical protein PROFUN_10575 [Planoprotostelium fungivorum]